MKKVFLVTAFATMLSSAAFAFDPIGPVDTRGVLYPPAPSSVEMANHKLYVQNLKDAGVDVSSTAPIGPVDTRPAMYPNHSKVPNGAHYTGPTPGHRDASSGF